MSESTFDYIVVGAGSAGCIVAARLAEDENCRVLLLDAGGSDRTALIRKPGMVSIIHTVPQVKKKFDWGYYTAARDETLGRRIPYVRGKVLGGSGSINGMVFVRGHKANFDGWAEEGCPGWSHDDVLPFFKRMETFEDGETEHRGGSGPVQVTRAKEISPVSEAFRHAVAETCNVPLLDDYNGEKQEGASYFQLNQRDGIRSSSAETYLHPAIARCPNLDVQTRATVHRIEFEGTRATGITYEQNGTIHTAHADSEVVLCAGVIGSAQILMLSGIGPAAHLAEFDITARGDLPVGQNLHDHLFFPMTFVAPRGGHRGTPLHFFGGMLKEYLFGDTWFGRSVFESVAFVKTDAAKPVPDLQLHSLPWSYPSPNQDAPVRPTVDLRPALTVQPTLIYPQSRGEMRLLSADPNAAPHMDPHFLEEAADTEALMQGIAMTREIMAASAIAQEITLELHPGQDYMDDAAMRAELPNRVCTVYHPVGTCRMGSDERAVVGPDLKVRGFEGLRVADASIMPQVTGGNTNAASMMIGEKAAALLRQT